MMRDPHPESRDDPFLPEQLGQYKIIRKIGRGGMGVVLEAEDTAFAGARHVAVKVLPQNALLDARRVKRFENEAIAAASLQHDNIVRVLNRGVQDGVHYFAMDYIQGANLAQVIASLRTARDARNASTHRPTETSNVVDLTSQTDASVATDLAETAPRMHALEAFDSQLTTEHPTATPAPSSHSLEVQSHYRDLLNRPTVPPPDRRHFFEPLIALAIQAANALDHAHQMGVIHRDIKPSNLMVDTSGRLLVTDFGLAQMTRGSELTRTGDLIGTLRYMSPEQALAQRVVVDHRTDIYSLGITLYELFTLERAYDGTNEQILHQIAFVNPPAPRRINPQLPFELETIVLKAIEKNPNERYATASELAHDLRQFAEGKEIQAKRPTPVERAVRWSRKNTKLTLITAVAISCIAVAACFTAWFIYAGLLFQKQINQELTAALRVSEGLRLVANALTEIHDNPGLALILAKMGHDRHPSLEGNNAILAALEANHEAHALPHDTKVHRVRFDRSAQSLASTEAYDADLPEQPLRIWNAQTGDLLHKVVERGRSISSVMYGPTGRYLMTVGIEDGNDKRFGRVAIWAVANLKQPETILPRSHVLDLRRTWVGSDPLRIALPDATGAVHVWTVDGKQLKLDYGNVAKQGEVDSFALSRNGERLATIDVDGFLTIWNMTKDGYTARHYVRLSIPEKQHQHVEFDRAGKRVLTVSRGKVQVRDVESGDVLLQGWRMPRAQFHEESPDFPQIASFRASRLQLRGVVEGNIVSEHTTAGVNYLLHLSGVRFITHDNPFSTVVRDIRDSSVVAHLRGHTGAVRDAVLSPDGRWAATASDDATARIWKVDSYRDESTVRYAGERVVRNDAVLTGDHLLYGQASELQSVSLAQPSALFPGGIQGPKRIDKVAFIPSGTRLSIVDLPTAKQVASISMAPHVFLAAAFLADQQHAVVLTTTGEAWLWDLSSNKTSEILSESAMAANLTAHPTQQLVAIGCGTKKVILFAPGEKASELEVESEVVSCLFSPDGKYLVARTARHGIIAWDVTTREQVSNFTVPPKGSTVISADGKYLLYSTFVKGLAGVTVHELATGKQIRSLKLQGYHRLDVHPTESIAVIGSTKGLQRWNFLTDEEPRLISSLPITDVVLNQETIYAGVHARFGLPPVMDEDLDLTSRVQTWDLETGELQASFPCNTVIPNRIFHETSTDTFWYSGGGYELQHFHADDLTARNTMAGLTDRPNFVGYSQAINSVVTVSTASQMVAWNQTGKATPLIPNFQAKLHRAAIAPDGKYLAFVDADAACHVLDLQQGKVVASIDISDQGIADLQVTDIHSLQILDDAKRVLVAVPSHVLFWQPLKQLKPKTQTLTNHHACMDAMGASFFVLQNPPSHASDQSGNPDVSLLRAFSSPVNQLLSIEDVVDATFDNSGQRLLVTRPHEAVVYETQNGNTVTTLPSDEKLCSSCFNTTGSRIATISTRGMVLWDTTAREKTLVIRDETTSFMWKRSIGTRLGFSANDRWILWKGIGVDVRRWAVEPTEVAAARLPRELSAEEKQQFHTVVEELQEKKEAAPEN